MNKIKINQNRPKTAIRINDMKVGQIAQLIKPDNTKYDIIMRVAAKTKEKLRVINLSKPEEDLSFMKAGADIVVLPLPNAVIMIYLND